MNVDSETLQYPKEIAETIGLSTNEINALKRQGCPFRGRKTSVRLVRAFLYRTMGVESLIAPDAHPQHSNGNKSDEPKG
jgi:hypothetical protein